MKAKNDRVRFGVSIRKLFLFFIFLSLVVANDFMPGRILYAVFMGFVFLGILKIAINGPGSLKNSREKLVSFLGFAILVSWVYGVFLGSIFGVPEKYVFVNFAGMVFYFLLFLFFLIRPRFDDLAKVFLIGFFVQLLIGFIAFFQNVGSILTGGFEAVESISELRSTYSIGFSVGFPVFTVSLYALLNNKYFPEMYMFGPKSTSFFFLLSFFLVVVPAMSKGFILAVMLLGALVFLASFSRSFIRMKVSKLMIVSSFASFAFLLFMLQEYFDVIVYTFSDEEISNAKRAEQADYILDELTFWGAGLGAGLDSGYTRASEPYAFELSYHSILHKLGFMALPLFFAYFYCFFKSALGIFLYSNGLRFAFSLGLMGYAIVGIGNPILLGGLGVLYHVVSLYLLASGNMRKGH